MEPRVGELSTLESGKGPSYDPSEPHKFLSLPIVLVRLTPNPGQVVVWSGGLEGRLVGLSGQVVFVL